MSVLLLRLAGPLQSWGTQSRFSLRDAGLEPSKSGVIGLLCAALGRPREASVADLVDLRMAVRADHEGRLASDFQTAGGSSDPDGEYGVAKADGSRPETVISRRYFLADADFLVGLEGDTSLLRQVEGALDRPVWPLYLGRKAFVPGAPVRLPDGFLPGGGLLECLKSYPWTPRRGDRPQALRLVVETYDADGELRWDVPVSFRDRIFATRRVRTTFVNLPVETGVSPCS